MNSASPRAADATNAADAHAAVAALDVWRGHSVRLMTFAVGSIVAAVALFLAAAGPDGRDPFYVALAIEFAAWGAINLFFALSGIRGSAALRRAGDDAATIAKARDLLRLLGVNAKLNVVWIATGLALIAWGYRATSPGIAGHGYGVLAQAAVLTVMDVGFVRGLRRAVGGAAARDSAS